MKVETTMDVHVLMGIHFPAAALTAALERGLFWQLEGGPQPLAVISEAMGISPRICRNWLRALSSLGLLQEVESGYALSEAARKAIIDAHQPATWSELAREERKKWPGDVALIGRLFEPEATEQQTERSPGQLRDYVQAMADDPQQAHRFTHMLYDLHQPLAEDVARQLALGGAKRLLDIGGGSGVVSLALLSKHPELTATVVDIPTVCAVGRQIADGTSEAGRITYYPANYYLDEFPGRFDLILACDIIGYDQLLIDKVVASLEGGGRFVIVDRWFEECRDWSVGQSAYLLRRSLADPDFSIPSIAEVYSRLRTAGLEPESRETLPYGRWQMIQARKNA
jgi:predicted TPR repeat methyltransferase